MTFHRRRMGAQLMRSVVGAAAIAVGIATLSGCSTWWQRHFAARELVTESVTGKSTALSFTFPYAWYENDPAQTSVFLSDIPPEQLVAGSDLTGQIVHIQMMWLPRPGWTPARKGCTNVVIRLLVLSKGEIGLYGGGGFAWPWDEPGDSDFGMDVLASSLSLLEKTNGFVDLLSPAQMTGATTAPLDGAGAQRMRMVTSQLVTNAFKSVRWVRVWEGDAPLALEALDGPAASASHDTAIPDSDTETRVQAALCRHFDSWQRQSASSSAGASASR